MQKQETENKTYTQPTLTTLGDVQSQTQSPVGPPNGSGPVIIRGSF